HMAAEAGVQRVPQRRVMLFSDTVFAVITPELDKEGHRFLGSLRDQFTKHPPEHMTEGGPLRNHVGGKQVANGRIGREPPGIELVYQFVVSRLWVERRPKRAQRVTILQSHARRL